VQGFRPKRSLEVMMFTSEEPTRFKLSCVGSRAMAGALAADTLDVKLDENGTSFLEVGACYIRSHAPLNQERELQSAASGSLTGGYACAAALQ
jgi:hypothetical protein